MEDFKLNRQPDWPEKMGSPYAFNVGYEPNKGLLAAALTPRTKQGRANLAARLVLVVLLFKLNKSRQRLKYKSDPRFGNYRYVWFHMHELEAWAGLNKHQAERGMKALIDGGIVYATRANKNQPRSYRLTDAAFMMAHAFQYPHHRLTWTEHHVYSMLDTPKGGGQLNATLAKNELNNMSAELADRYRLHFAQRIAEWKPHLDQWHSTPHPSGRRQDPYECGFIDVVRSDCGDIFEKLDKLIEEATPITMEALYS
ncbi:hypothetical protein J7382_11920 [Shimia sp. R11_0]|uniref:hypothetical protein n=1 Tax=Shimia sp. R11_0 TaxID=2821096 RepID=UPI001ADB36D3|nr:hypothetical protein [Shimia sp. R11_0]MBO9478243.1 hypothetical protein [Shimia sp. R11_0]